jgi:hypothetical protein
LNGVFDRLAFQEGWLLFAPPFEIIGRSPTRILIRDLNANPKNRGRAHPTVNEAAIVSDLKSPPLNGLNEVQVVLAFHFAEDDVANLDFAVIDGHNGAELARTDPPYHGTSAWPELHRLAAAQPLDVVICPPH